MHVVDYGAILCVSHLLSSDDMIYLLKTVSNGLFDLGRGDWDKGIKWPSFPYFYGRFGQRNRRGSSISLLRFLYVWHKSFEGRFPRSKGGFACKEKGLG
jgi:hypothetical protein